MVGLKEHLFRWDELIVKKDMDKKDSKEFIVYPTNSAQGPGDRFVGPTGIVLTLNYLLLFYVIIIYSLVLSWLAMYLLLPVIGALLGLILYYNPQRDLSTDNDDSTNKPVCLCSYFCPNRPVLKYRAWFKTAGERGE